MASAKTPEPRGAAAEPAGSEYLTVAAPAKAQLREKMSRFIAFVFPVSSAEQAREEIARVAADYHDARHVCWAYRLGADGTDTQCNDNGEPSGTAGRPILGQIRSAGLTNVAVAVVRYFGGIKLGTSGLITAYKEATRLAIEEAEIVTGFETDTVTVVFPYMAINDVMRVAKDPGIRIVDQVFDNSCLLTLETRADHVERLLQRLTDIDGVTEK
ncbi:MAG: YigZ family protein [Bacteroides sp.]|nr:YigZ family protein [Bacteroides sp.]MDE7470174.1 IMPACT family protein [Paramuribaculum sp.]